MTGFSSLHHNTSSLYSRMADVHLPSVNKNAKSLSNSMSTISPSLPPHDFTYILNSNPEYICQAESGAWQRFIPNLHNSFSSQFPSSLPQTGYESNDETVESAMMRELIGRLGNGEFSNGLTSLATHSTDYSCKFEEEHGWRGMDASSNISFSLDLPQQNHSLPVTSLAPSARLAGTPSDPGYAESQDRFPSLCHGQHCLDSSKSVPMVTAKEHIPAFTSPSTTAQSRGKAMQSTCQREEECAEHSGSSGHNAVQSPSTPVKGGISGKKRNASEDKIVDARSPVTCAVHKVVKKPKTEDMKAKQQKSSESIKQAEEVNKKAEPNSMGNSGCTSSKDPEPPKRDFIHVRARRGQATDSHSLAERVRREKISERMKFLQDLVPGCSKVSGKAVMLDEIINYVQSLQHQVESLSMKLASLNTRPNFSLDGIFGTEVLQRHITSSPFGYNHELISNLSLLNSTQAKMNELVRSRCTGGLDLRSLSTNQGITTKRSNANMSNSNIFKDANSQTSNLWEEEVQNIMQIGF